MSKQETANHTNENSSRLCMEEMNDMLVRLVHFYQFDFENVAKAFQKYLVFLKTIYQKELGYIDHTMFTSNICRARYALLDWKKYSFVSSSKSEEPVQTKKTLKDHYSSMYKEVNKSLPTIEEQASDDETIFQSNLPPPTEFEQQLFKSDVDFWGMHGKDLSAFSLLDLRKDAHKEELEILEEEWKEVSQSVLANSPLTRKKNNEGTSMDVNIYKKLQDMDMDSAVMSFSQKAQRNDKTESSPKETKQDKKSTPPLSSRMSKSRAERMKIVSHDSD
ncbi:hypothetical protein ABK040_009360 [Willaertia magna]